jgi:DNA ligase-1
MADKSSKNPGEKSIHMTYIPGKPTWQKTHPRFSPILGAGIKKDMTMDQFFAHVLYPVIATPKFDGIRVTTLPGSYDKLTSISIPVCRSLKLVPNDYICEMLSQLVPCLDGEILTYPDQGDLLDATDMEKPHSFNRVSSDVMTHVGRPRFKFHVFDHLDFNLEHPHLVPYEERLEKLKTLELPSICVNVPTRLCGNRQAIEDFESEMVEAGYEGICWRHPLSTYKYGRSTLRSQQLIKMKRFESAEAIVIDTYEEMGNNNPSVLNMLGYAERSSHKENMKPKGRLGGLVLKCSMFEETFNCGSGFNASDREELWKDQDALKGKIVTFKFQRHGSKDRPRIPIFVGFRSIIDM